MAQAIGKPYKISGERAKPDSPIFREGPSTFTMPSMPRGKTKKAENVTNTSRQQSGVVQEEHGTGGTISLSPRPAKLQQPQSEQSKVADSQSGVPMEWLDQIREEFREQMSGDDWINTEWVEAYKWGDRVGLPFEGGTMFQSVDEQRLQLALKSNRGSDESSIVDCFIRFVESYTYTALDQFVWDWLSYHQLHHGTGYGRTYRDHFALVKYMRKHTEKYPDLQSKLAKLLEISTDADSYGNGALAIVYPAYCYALAIDEDPAEFVRHITSYTHANPDVLEAVTRLCLFIEAPETIAQFYEDSYAADDDEFKRCYCTGHATASNTLVTAVKCSMKNDELGVIRETIRIGGDTDSTLATAMLIWSLRGSVSQCITG